MVKQTKPKIKEDEGTLLEESVEELQSEIIFNCLKQWRGYERNDRNKRLIIELGVKIFDMLVKYKASQMDLKDLKTQLDALRAAGVMLPET